jgi:hypothetical protein
MERFLIAKVEQLWREAVVPRALTLSTRSGGT